MEFYKLIAITAFFCLDGVYGMTQTPWLIGEDLNAVLLTFYPISRDAIISEIKQRTAAENDVCGDVVQDDLLKWAENITDPKVEIYIHVHSKECGDALPCLNASVVMLIPGDGMSLGLAYVPIFESMIENPVGNGILSDQTVTISTGNGHLTVEFEWKKSCPPSSKGMNPYSSGKLFHSWYPKRSEDFSKHCTKTGSVRDDFCDLMLSHQCNLDRTQGDFCFLVAYEGNGCEVNAKVTEMTGVFRERSLTTTSTPFKSMDGYYFEGIDKLGLAYPCIHDD